MMDNENDLSPLYELKRNDDSNSTFCVGLCDTLSCVCVCVFLLLYSSVHVIGEGIWRRTNTNQLLNVCHTERLCVKEIGKEVGR